MNHPKVVYLTAGAAGMYCGSCIRDNALVEGLAEQNWDVYLLPLYTPIRVDGADHSVDQLFFGGINVYLQQKIPFFRWLPGFLDRWLDHPGLVRRVASRALSVSAPELGNLTLSMVKGEHGYQRKEVMRLVEWLRDAMRPELICLTNLLVGGSIPALKRELGVPVLVTLQGDDLFLGELLEPWRSQVLAEMKRLAAEVDGFITFSAFYRDEMAQLFEIPLEKFHLVPLGVVVEEFDGVLAARHARPRGQTIGYFARLSPEKGFDVLVDAFIKLALTHPQARLRVGGWLSPKDEEFYATQVSKLEAAGLLDRFERIEAPDATGKRRFFEEVDLFCVPAKYREPKGLYMLEAMACGLPVVGPNEGAFPEMIQGSGGGLLVIPGNAEDLAEKLGELLDDPIRAAAMGVSARRWVETEGSSRRMATVTGEVFDRIRSEPSE
jgi:glycosyltransferase involved in cell wall biosynthesis